MAKRSYTQREIDVGLTALAVCDGSAKRAERELTAMGNRIPATTLAGWKRERAADLERVSRELAPQLREQRAQALDNLAHAGVEVSQRGLDLLNDKLGELHPKDLGGAIRNAATVVGIATEKAALLRDQPTAIVAHDYSASLSALKRKGLVVEGEAVEIEDKVPA